jgi:endonuclease-3
MSAESARGRSVRQTISEIVRRLRREYGRASPPRRLDPLGELIFTVLSQHTADTNTYPAYQSLCARFDNWDAVRRAPVRSIVAAIRRAGLANQKAPRIKGILQEIHRREGSTSLDALRHLSTDAAADYLGSLHGVGPKTVACVLLFACGRPVLPVDTHVHRLGKRLGLIDPTTSADAAHGVLGRLVPERLVLDFHVKLLEHGRAVCKSRIPRCTGCVLLDLCPEGRLRTGA